MKYNRPAVRMKRPYHARLRTSRLSTRTPYSYLHTRTVEKQIGGSEESKKNYGKRTAHLNGLCCSDNKLGT